MTNSQIVKSAYEAFARGDVPGLLGLMDDKVEWKEADGFPYAGTYIGPEAVLNGVFARVASEWDGFAAVPDRLIADGDLVITTGTYSGKYIATGKSFEARFCHVFELREGKFVRMEQIVDSAMVVEAITA